MCGPPPVYAFDAEEWLAGGSPKAVAMRTLSLTTLSFATCLAVACGSTPSSETSNDAGPGQTSSTGSASSSGSTGTGRSSSTTSAGSLDGGPVRDAGTASPDGSGPGPTGDAGGGDAGAGDSGADTGAVPIPLGNAKTLRAGADALGRLVGVAFNTTHTSDPGYTTTASTEFNFVTPENEMKWDTTEPSQNAFSFTAGDAVVSFAAQNNMKVKGHNLVWFNELPTWVSSLTTANAVQSAMTNHITKEAGHYKGQVVAWDVVNEAIADDGSGLRSDVFSQLLGSSYVDIAYQTARAADPNALLIYNDFGIEGNLAKSDAAFNMVQSMVQRGIPIDGVGFEFHVQAPDAHPQKSVFVANMQRYVALGLKIFISEFDVELCTGTPSDQQTRFHDIVQACFSEPACAAVTVWGVTDKFSWLNGNDCATPMPLLFDDSYGKKPAYTGFLAALNGM
jgi:endo-1,4-beta-xylanase